ncbi:hypothetical protein E0Z10_g6204 [Xylaria hypoxylon]|uniref:protein-histidine N-methyltransferase n=1 Tax=Xylaria hypoxylon TaxID=37992 RepID=A0A4Z0YVS7_9PEZI|nr:hypothetical protein E0Z10_g6204 [Xylaria hypoxylon]
MTPWPGELMAGKLNKESSFECELKTDTYTILHYYLHHKVASGIIGGFEAGPPVDTAPHRTRTAPCFETEYLPSIHWFGTTTLPITCFDNENSRRRNVIDFDPCNGTDSSNPSSLPVAAMSGQFSFSFSGEDIEADSQVDAKPDGHSGPQPSTSTSAFPVAGKPLLPATCHDLKEMISKLPSKVAFSLLDVDLDGQGNIQLPRRELWDVRVQLMAEEDEAETEPGLGNHDVKTGVYEGGFKSWESSVDLVKVLASSQPFTPEAKKYSKIVELGCGTALPSLALFQWAMGSTASSVSFILTDYNPTVLQLVTLPNFILAWAIHHREGLPLLSEAFSLEGELDLTPEILEAFQEFLLTREISLLFFSGAWSPEFVKMIANVPSSADDSGTEKATVIMGAETIYSPFALSSFLEAILALIHHEKAHSKVAEVLVGAKRLYFGVGGSLDDFVIQARERGALVEKLREEIEGVRRGVVRCALP